MGDIVVTLFRWAPEGLATGFLYALLAVSYGLIYRATRVFHVAFGPLFVMSGVFLALLVETPGSSVWFNIILVIALSGVLGVLVEFLVYWRFHCKGRGSVSTMVASVGLATVLTSMIVMKVGPGDVSINANVQKLHVEWLAKLGLTYWRWVGALVCGAILLLLWGALNIFRPMKLIWAMGDDPDLFVVLGKPIRRHRIVVFAIGTALAAVPACFIGLDAGVQPRSGLRYVLLAVVGMLFGGADRFGGWVAGGIGLALINGAFASFFGAQWTDLCMFSLLVGLLFLWPRGIFGIAIRTEQQ